MNAVSASAPRCRGEAVQKDDVEKCRSKPNSQNKKVRRELEMFSSHVEDCRPEGSERREDIARCAPPWSPFCAQELCMFSVFIEALAASAWERQLCHRHRGQS